MSVHIRMRENMQIRKLFQPAVDHGTVMSVYMFNLSGWTYKNSNIDYNNNNNNGKHLKDDHLRSDGEVRNLWVISKRYISILTSQGLKNGRS